MEIGRIEAIHRYPVKSTAGESLQDVELGSGGIPGDRFWALRDDVRDCIAGAKKFPALMGFSSRFIEPSLAGVSSPAEIVFPDGMTASTDDGDINDRLTEVLGHGVSLHPLRPAKDLEFYRRGKVTREDMEAELRAVFGRTPQEPLPDLSTFPPELFEFESPPGTYFDAFPLLLLTTTSLATMQERTPDSVFDKRRFRPNFVIRSGVSSEPFPEMAWCGKRIGIGEAVVEVVMECPRCVMTTHGFDDLPKDPGIMRALVRESGGNLGVYAKPLQPGRVKVGDAVTLSKN